MSDPKSSLAAVFSGFCLALPVLGVLASRGVVPLLLIAAALAGLIVWRSDRRLPMPDRGMTAVLALLLAWCAVASLWSFDVLGSLVLTLRIGVVFAAGLFLFAVAGSLDDGQRDRIGRWLVAGTVLALLVMIVEVTFDFPILGSFKEARGSADRMVWLNRGATAMAMISWPAAAFLWQRGLRGVALTLPALTGALLSLLVSLAAVLGLAAGGLAALIALTHRKAGRVLLVLVGFLLLVGTPLAAKEIYAQGWHQADWLVSSAKHRIEIWNFAAQRIAEKPIQGWGFDSSRAMSKHDGASSEGGLNPMPLHPHSAPLQVLLELGAAGGVIVFALLWLLTARLDGLPATASRCFGQALFATTLVIASVSYGLWQTQWLAMMISAALLVPLTTRPDAPDEAPGRTADRLAPPER